MIRAVIADDEPLAREGLRLRLASEPDIEVVGEAADGDAAIERVLAERPDLLFLDVQMPGVDGFEVLERVSGDYLPWVIFVTSFDRHAVRAFEFQALDYLLKPVTDERLASALGRARQAIARGDRDLTPQRIGGLLDERFASAGHASGHMERIAVPHHGGFVLVRLAEVDYIEAAANYVALHAGERHWLLRSTLQELERRLDPRRFARIHRSTIVAVDRVREIATSGHGGLEIVLEGGRRLAMSRKFKDRLLP